MTKTVFAIAAHPDDIEFVMAGTLLLLKQHGCKIHYMNIANGSMGSNCHSREDILRIRREEAIRGAKKLGAVYHESLVNDLDIFYNTDTCMKLCSIIRQVEPDILLVQSPQDYMEDHQNAVRLAVTAAFCRGMPLAPVNPPYQATMRDVTIYHAQPHGNRDALRRFIRPGLYVNIKSVIEEKQTVLASHQSQQSWLDDTQKMNAYVDGMVDMAKELGQVSQQFIYAEGWRRHSHLGFCSSGADPLSAILNDLTLVDKEYERSLVPFHLDC